MTGPDEPVGSVGAETAKLLGALADWAKGSAGQIDAHLATGAAECQYCPICRTVHVLREANPEVRAQLATAAASLLQVAAGILGTMGSPAEGAAPGRPNNVQHIDLDDDLDADLDDDLDDDLNAEPEDGTGAWPEGSRP